MRLFLYNKLSMIKEKIKKEAIELIKSFLIALLICFFLIKFVMMSVVVDGTSMLPNLHNGDFGFSFVITRNISIKRFDTVVINASEESLVYQVKRLNISIMNSILMECLLNRTLNIWVLHRILE